jgi:hypothetical protein
MYVVKATEELLVTFLTKGNKVWDGKCFQGLPAGCKLESVTLEKTERDSQLIVGRFSHPDEEKPEEDKDVQVNYETKWTRKTMNQIKKARH